MNLKIQHANDAVLQHAGELLRAHQVIMDAWYASWVDEQRARVVALYRKKENAAQSTQPPIDRTEVG